MRMPLGVLHVDSWNLHTKDASVDRKNYSIMTDHANTNTFHGKDGADGTLFCPTGQRKSIYLSFSSKQGNLNKYGHYTKKNSKKRPYNKAISAVFLPSFF